MTAKEYLNRIRKQRFVVQQAKRELMEVQSDILTLRAASLEERVSGTKTSDIADKYIRLERYCDSVIDELNALNDMKKEAKVLIKMLPESDQQGVLYARYINGLDWKSIAKEKNIGPRGAQKLHARALAAFERVHRSSLAKRV